jgi:hypothetical protein
VRERKSTTDEALNAERSTRSASAHPQKDSGESAFLLDVRRALQLWSPAFADTELDNWGGWWRNRYRENGKKALRVLAEIRGMVREGRIRGNPGAAAGDLWKRLP